MKIVKFEDKYRQAFIDINAEWITKLFGKIEPDDVETFEHIDELIAEGAMIFFAVEDEKVLAACMAKPTGGGEWEMCKMGAAGQYTGTGAGSSRTTSSAPRCTFSRKPASANARWDTANTSAATSHTNISSKTTNKCARRQQSMTARGFVQKIGWQTAAYRCNSAAAHDDGESTM